LLTLTGDIFAVPFGWFERWLWCPMNLRRENSTIILDGDHFPTRVTRVGQYALATRGTIFKKPLPFRAVLSLAQWPLGFLTHFFQR